MTPTVAGASNTQSVAFTLDGVTNATAWIERGQGEFPPLDGIQEFKVITSAASAEFGKANQVIVVSKGGTNEYHGTLLYFNRNRVMAAKNFFATHLDKPKYNRNEFGGNFSGPVTLPGVYEGRNRTFFFFNAEAFRRRQSETKSAQVATQAMRAGDFTGLATITDPLGQTPFPDNRIPSERLNPVTKRLGDLYPTPNRPGTGAAGTGINLTENLPLNEYVNRYSARVDHTLSNTDQIYGTMMIAHLGPNPSNGPVSTFGGMQGVGEHNTNLSLTWNHSLTPSIINELRTGYMHLRIYRTPQNVDLDVGGIIPGLGTQALNGAPQLNITNIQSMTEAGSNDLHQSLQLIDNLSLIRGSHSFKMGYAYQHPDHYNFAARSPQRGTYSFNGQYSGVAYADFVLGYPASTQRPTPSVFFNKFRQHRHAFYFQDEWKATRNLTVNYGVRYELQLFQGQRAGQVSMFLPEKNGIAVFRDSYPNQTIQRLVDGFGIRLAKDYGLSSDLFQYLGQDTNNFAPRAGLAYKVSPTMVIRAGTGIYYNTLTLNATEQLAIYLPFGLVESFEQPAGKVPTITMNNPFPGQGSIPANPTTSMLARPVTPYTLQWNLTLEKEVFGDVGLRLGYYGQRNIKQHGSPDINAVGPAPGPAQPRRPYQPYAGIGLNLNPMYQSTANQLQAGIQKRYSKGLLLNAEYQYARVIGVESYMDPFNWNDSRGSLNGIRKHVLVLSYAYDLPFGRGKQFLGNAKGLTEALIGGWNISGITQALSGSPFSPSFTTSVQGSVGGRPNVVPGALLYPATRTLAQYFNPAAFAKPAEFTYGNAGYNLLWGPGQQSWDASLSKTSLIRERVSLMVKFEAFSVFNHPTFGNPAAAITNTASVGRISSAGGNRTCQLGAKLMF